MNVCILVTHLSGSSSGQKQELRLEGASELTCGRDPASDIRYDSARDDVVSRRHLKLYLGTAPGEIWISDLGSRNGTFVNGERLVRARTLKTGDTVQVGAGGPEFRVELVDSVKAPIDGPETRTSERLDFEVPAPVITHTPRPQAPEQSPSPPEPQRKSGVALAASILACFVLVLVGAGLAARSYGPALRNAFDGMHTGLRLPSIHIPTTEWLAKLRSYATVKKAVSPADVAKENQDSIASVEVAWKLESRDGGQQLYQVYAPNQNSENAVLVEGAGPLLPVFVLLGANRLEPVLTTDATGLGSRPIGGRAAGSGFVFGPAGSIVSTRQLVEPWQAPYRWPSEDIAGLVLSFDSHDQLQRSVILASQFPRWVPAEAKLVLQDSTRVGKTDLSEQSTAPKVAGKAEAVSIKLAAWQSKAQARLLAATETSQLALVQTDPPRSIPHPEHSRRQGPMHAGDEAILVSYGPGDAGAAANIGVLSTLEPDPGDPKTAVPAGTLKLVPKSTNTPLLGGPVFDRQGRLFAICSPYRDAAGQVLMVIPLSSGGG